MNHKAVCAFGSVGVDLLSVVASFPKPDDKIRCLESQVLGGGNAGNVAVALKRLSSDSNIHVKLVSKIGTDVYGRKVVEEFEHEKIDISDVLQEENETTPFTYVLVSKEDCSRTCIHHPLGVPLNAEHVKSTWLQYLSSPVNLLFLDSRHHIAAIQVGKLAREQGIPVLLDMEKMRPGTEELLDLCTLLNTSSHFPEQYTKEKCLLSSLVRILELHIQISWCVTTLGDRGCLLMERYGSNIAGEEISSISSLESLVEEKSWEDGIPKTTKGIFKGHQVYYCPASKVECIVDTTGCGDAFVGALLFSILHHWHIEKMLSFSTVVAGLKTEQMGARAALPFFSHTKLASFFNTK